MKALLLFDDQLEIISPSQLVFPVTSESLDNVRERGKRNVPLKTMKKIAQALEIPIASLLPTNYPKIQED